MVRVRGPAGAVVAVVPAEEDADVTVGEALLRDTVVGEALDASAEGVRDGVGVGVGVCVG
jgi:hypothetical protein